MRYLILITMLLTSLAAIAVDDCCNIISVDPAAKSIVVREIATGKTKSVKISSTRLLEQLKPGLAFGPSAIQGIQTPLHRLEPAWAEECCNFTAAHVRSSTNMSPKSAPTTAGIIQTSPSSKIAAVSAVELTQGVTIHDAMLKRRGKRSVKLEFSVTNNSDSSIALVNYGMVNNGQLTKATLIDIDAGKRYEVVTDDKGDCVCSRADLFVGAKATKKFWAHFAAPPADVSMLTLEIPGGVPVEDIPVQ